jgi:polyhydroxyalkanoate synthase
MSLQMNYLGAAEAVVRETFQLGVELAKIAGGTSTVSPAAADRRFADPAWSENPMYRRQAQVYLAWAAGVNRVADDLDTNGADWRTAERARLAAGILVSALAPTNTVWGNPRGAQARLGHGRRESGAGFPELA